MAKTYQRALYKAAAMPVRDRVTLSHITSLDDQPASEIWTLEAAVLTGMWGLRWAGIATEEGVHVAATFPLPKEEEAKVQGFAKSLATATPDEGVLVRQRADVLVRQAMAAFRVSMRLLWKAQNLKPVTERWSREAFATIGAAERLGRAAAKAERFLLLLSREREGVN